MTDLGSLYRALNPREFRWFLHLPIHTLGAAGPRTRNVRADGGWHQLIDGNRAWIVLEVPDGVTWEVWEGLSDAEPARRARCGVAATLGRHTVSGSFFDLAALVDQLWLIAEQSPSHRHGGRVDGRQRAWSVR